MQAIATPALTLDDVRAAQGRIRPYLPETPLVQPPLFREALGLDVWLKLETAQPVGAFKVRGGVNYMSHRAEQVRASGVVTASTGNHGQSIAYAAQLFGVPATIYVPRDANPSKVASMRAMGANVVLQGKDTGESAAAARADAEQRGATFISSGSEPLLIAGVATAALEALERRPFDVMIVPAAAGTHAAGTALVAKAFSREIRTIAVCSAQAPAVHDAWRSGTPVTYDSLSTMCEGLATRESYGLSQELMRAYLDDFETLDDAEILSAMRYLLEYAHHLVEPAGAAALAYVLRHRDELRGARIYVPLTGANVTPEQLRAYVS